MRRVAMLVVVGLLAACGSDDDSGSSDDDNAPQEEPGNNEQEERDLDADQELAEGAVLTIDDVPEGFEVDPEDDDEDEDEEELDRLFAECVGISVEELDDDDEPQASSTFTTEDQESINSEVIVHETEDEVAEDLEMVSDADNLECMADAMDEVFGSSSEVELGEIRVQELVVEDLGQDAAGAAFALPFIVEGGERVFYIDLVLIQQGRTAISMGYSAFDQPFDEELVFDLAETVVERVPADA